MTRPAARLRRAATLAAGLLALGALGACGGSDPGSSSGGSPEASIPASPVAAPLTIWADPSLAPAVREIAAAHTAASGTAVTVEPIPTATIRERLLVLAPQGQGPDVFLGRSDWVGALADRGLVAPVDVAAQESQFRPVSLDAFTYQQKVYGVPFATENVALLRNTDLAPLPPESIEQMADQGLALEDEKRVQHPIALPIGPAGDAHHWYPLYSASGGFIFGQDLDGGYTTESIGVGEPGSIRAAEDLAGLAEKGAIEPTLTEEQAVAAFAQGEAAYLIAGPGAVAPAEAAGITFVVEAIPGFATTTRPLSQSLVTADGYLLSAFARNAGSARDFLARTAMTTQAMDALFAAGNRVPAWNTSYETASSDAVVKGFGQVADSSVPSPNLAVMDQVWPILDEAEVAVLAGAGARRTMRSAGEQVQAAVDAG